MSTSRTVQITLTRAQWNELCAVLRAEIDAINRRNPDGYRDWTEDARLNACSYVIAAATRPNNPNPEETP